MHEHAATLDICPGRMEEAVAILQESIVPILRSQPGLLSLALIPIAANHQITVLSMWKSLAQAQAIERNPRYCQAWHRLKDLLQAKVPVPLN